MSDNAVPLTPSDDSLRAFVEGSNLVALFAALAHVTGDLGLVRTDIRPEAVAPHQGALRFPEASLPTARELAFTALKSFLAKPQADREITSAELREIFTFATADSVAAHTDLLRSELALPSEGSEEYEEIGAAAGPVAIIGAGMSGLAAAYRLQRAGVPYVIYEKNSGVGGTWFENLYPGARVDANNYVYSFSYAQRRDWPENYSTQPVILEYLEDFARDTAIVQSVRFGQRVTAMAFDDSSATWDVTSEDADGARATSRYRAVITAVGQLNNPGFPNIPGIDTFRGATVHSGAWDTSIDLAGKRVAVIGTGATAAQVVPEIAEQARSVTVFQRTAPWLLPVRDYRHATSETMQWLVDNVPHYAAWHRMVLFSGKIEGMLPYVSVDEQSNPDEHAVSDMNRGFRAYLESWINEQTEDDPELRQKLTPDYPPGGKRMVVDDGTWIRTLKRDNVQLVTDGIAQITRDGVAVVGGREVEADVIVYATGFTATQFFTGITVTGRGGVSLDTIWNGDASAYLGIFIDRLPNFFTLFGPNTGLVVNGSLFFMTEASMHLVVKALRFLADNPGSAIEVRPEILAAFNAKLDAANSQRAWGFTSIGNWYTNASGRVSQIWPFPVTDYWDATRNFDPNEFSLVQAHTTSDV